MSGKFPATFPFVFEDFSPLVGQGTIAPSFPTFPYTFPYTFASSASLKVKIVGRLVGQAVVPVQQLLFHPPIRVRGIMGDGSIGISGDWFRIWIHVRTMGEGQILIDSTIGRVTRAILSGLISPLGTVSKMTSNTVGIGLITPSANPGRVAVRFFQILVADGLLTPSSLIVRETVKNLLGSVSGIGSLAKNTMVRPGQGTITSMGIWSRHIQVHLALTGSLSPSGLIKRMTQRYAGQGQVGPSSTSSKKDSNVVGEASLATSSVLIRIGEKLSGRGTLTPQGSISRVLTFARTFSGVVGISGAFSRKFIRLVGQGTITPTGSWNFTGQAVRIYPGQRQGLTITPSQDRDLSIIPDTDEDLAIAGSQLRR